MYTGEIISELRRNQNLSQEAMAERLFVTRQAVSRWETGETIPNTETLKLIAKEFGVSVDALLGVPSICQSCGMALVSAEVKGSEADGAPSEEYCSFCYQNGAFAEDLTMEELIGHNLRYLNEWNRAEGLQLTAEQAREQLREFLPTLKRWQPERA